ncbi:MAG TPA: CHAP domain-containing protein [Ktedonobacterales bacterium]
MTLYHSITRAFRSSRLARTGLTLGGALALVLAISAFTANPAQAASFRFQRGYSVQRGWLCYGWPNGALHCTAHWHRTASGKLVSDNPAWVPNVGGTSSSGSGSGGSGGSSGSAPAGISQWAIPPGYHSYAMGDFAGDPNHAYFGVCTWYAWDRRKDRGLLVAAYRWTSTARARGIPTGSAPAAGATAVFQPGVQGAGGGGHVAHVERVLGGGWFLVSEMNFYFNGGGWGRVSYRYAHSGSGVSFVY